MEELKFSEEDYLWDFKNSYEWMRKIRKGLPPLIISVAITGGIQGKEMNPNLPETKEEQAEQTYAAYKAGASIVHIHARRPDDPSKVSSDPQVYPGLDLRSVYKERNIFPGMIGMSGIGWVTAMIRRDK